MEERKYNNAVYIEGILAENGLKDIVFGNNQKAIAGNMVIKVPIEDTDDFYMIPVNFFASELKKDGGISKNYMRFKEYMDFLSIAASSEEEADRVWVSGATLSTLPYIPRGQNDMKFRFQITSNFINKSNPQSYRPRADFVVDGVVVKREYRPSLDLEGNETEAYMVTMLVPNYTRCDLIDFTVKNPAIIDYIEGNIGLNPNEPDTVWMAGTLEFISQEIVQKIEVAAGDPTERVVTRRSYNAVVTGLREPYDSDNKMSNEEIRERNAARKEYLKEQKDKLLARQAEPRTATPAAAPVAEKESTLPFDPDF